ncbi:MAG: DUF962 domain-containing protein [Planctomycetes bacterium]|nr:DUF962 domain-containing protein [Planctomycetota bacterium]
MAGIPNAPIPEFNCFAEFWQHYLSQHRHPLNRVLHALGTVGGLVCLGMAACFSWTWFLAVLPVGYGLAWLGHFLIERNRPLTFAFPWWSLRADYKLVGMLLMGRLQSAAEMPAPREV